MKLQVTLTLVVITLFFNNISALSSELSACNQAIGKGDSIDALKHANALLIINKNDKDALICKGRALSVNGDQTGALVAYKLADEQSKNSTDKMISTLLIGNTYKSLKQYEEAIASYQLTILNAKTSENQAFERIGHNSIGDVLFEKNQLSEALPEYIIGSKIAANDNERGESYEKIALIHHNMNQNDLALEYQIKAYLMNEASGSLDQYAHSSIELGRYYTILKNYISAENILNKIIKFANDQGGSYYEAQGSYLLAKVKVATGDIPAAKALIMHAKSIAIATKDKALDAEIDKETIGLF